MALCLQIKPTVISHFKENQNIWPLPETPAWTFLAGVGVRG